MAPQIQVSLPAVDELSARVLIASSDVKGALGSMQLNVCVDAGNADVSAAIDEFSQFWQSAVSDASAAIAQTGQAMASAAQQYGQVDSTVMVDPALTAAFTQDTLDGNSGAAQMLLGPMLPGFGTTSGSPNPLTGLLPGAGG
jgi:hypothetical protein